MSDSLRYRLSLVLAFVGALTILAQTWSDFSATGFGGSALPTFHRSAPDVREWPVHQYLPIG